MISQDTVHDKNKKFISVLSRVVPKINKDPFNIDIDDNLDRIGAWLNVPNKGYSTETYRHVLRAQIMKNNFDGSMMQLEELLSDFLPGFEFRINNNLNMSFSITVVGHLTDEQRNAIDDYDLIPRPAGVDMTSIIETDYTVFYGERTYNSGATYA